MKAEPQRICPSCGHEFSGAVEFCPVCMLRKALAGGVVSGESSFEEAVRPTSDQPAQRFDHYELVTGEDGKPVELGRGAMGVTYKAFDINLRCPVTLKSSASDISVMNRRGFVSCGRHAQRPAFVTQMLLRYCTWAEPGAVTSTRWSLWREKHWRISSNARAGWR
jgi:hypothetical protein